MRQHIHTDGPFHGVDGFNGIQHGRSSAINLQEDSAALGLIKSSKAYPDNFYVLCFAPLTNIALAMKVDKTFVSRVKQFYAMGGNFNAVGNASISGEFNFLADPEATYVVLRHATGNPIILAPWEVCGIDTHFSLVRCKIQKSKSTFTFHLLVRC